MQVIDDLANLPTEGTKKAHRLQRLLSDELKIPTIPSAARLSWSFQQNDRRPVALRPMVSHGLPLSE